MSKRWPTATLVNLCCLSLFVVLLPGFNPVQQLRLTPHPELGVRPLIDTLPETVILPKMRDNHQDVPEVTAKSVYMIDVESGVVMMAKNQELQKYPASLTKLMTAEVAEEVYEHTDILEVKDECVALGNTIKLQCGERITVDSLLHGLLIASGNDAAFVLANSYPHGGYAGFVAAMNAKAKELGMSNTTFLNVSGVEQEGHFTTAHDLAVLTREVMKNEYLRTIVKTENMVIRDVTGTIQHPLKATNILLGAIYGVEGVKTGWTTQAGECLITQTSRDGHTIILVVMDSTDRFGESARLITWAFANYEWNAYSKDGVHPASQTQ